MRTNPEPGKGVSQPIRGEYAGGTSGARIGIVLREETKTFDKKNSLLLADKIVGASQNEGKEERLQPGRKNTHTGEEKGKRKGVGFSGGRGWGRT